MALIKRYIRIIRRRQQATCTKNQFNKYLALISDLPSIDTLSQLDFSAGYYSGSITKAAKTGEIESKQKDQLIMILQYVYESERRKRGIE